MARFRLTSAVAAAVLATGTALGASGAQATISYNAMTLNALTANGMEAQGSTYQGLDPQGVSGNAVAAGPFEFNHVYVESVTWAQ